MFFRLFFTQPNKQKFNKKKRTKKNLMKRRCAPKKTCTHIWDSGYPHLIQHNKTNWSENQSTNQTKPNQQDPAIFIGGGSSSAMISFFCKKKNIVVTLVEFAASILTGWIFFSSMWKWFVGDRLSIITIWKQGWMDTCC